MALLFDAFLFGLGLAYGLVLVGLLYAVKQAVLEPAVEWTWEFFEQRFSKPHPNETRSSTFPPRGEVVVVSDLHIDTWDRAPGGREEREKSFLLFLHAIGRTSMELYINGDLLDAPLRPDDTWRGEDYVLKGSLLPKYEAVLAAIAGLNNQSPVPLRVSVLYGNHDMAASGLRYDLVKRDILQRFRAPFNMSWYPNIILGVPIISGREDQAKYRFYIDHGHFYDPALLLYLKDFITAALRSDLRRAMSALVLSGQRRSSEQQTIPRPGLAPAGSRTRDQQIGHWLVRYRWRWKARRVLTERNWQQVRLKNVPLTGALFGHTHLPDRYTYRTFGAKGMTYVNTGDWMGDTGHGTYTVITQDGVVKQYDWLDEQKRAPYHRGVAS